MIRVYTVNGFEASKTAWQYGLGYYMYMLRKAIQRSNKMKIVPSPRRADVIHIHDPVNIYEFKELLKLDKPIISHYHIYKEIEPIIFAQEHSTLNMYVSKTLRDSMGKPTDKVIYDAIIPRRKIHAKYRIIDFIISGRNSLDKLPKRMLNCENFFNVSTGTMKIKHFKHMGYVDEKKLDYLLAHSHLHLLPSKREAFGLSTLYAMAQGCVPVISKYAGVNEIVPPDLKIEIGDTLDCSKVYNEYLSRLLEDKRDEIINFARSHDYKYYSEQIYKIYKEVVS